MDMQLKASLDTDIVVHPFDKRVDGDSIFKDPIILKGSVSPKIVLNSNRQGDTKETWSLVIFDASDVDKINSQDEIEIPLIGRRTIKRYNPIKVPMMGFSHIEILA